MTHRTRIKICGLTRAEDVQAAVTAGADAIGFVFYSASSRAVSATHAASLLADVKPFVTSVGLFVNASAAEVSAVLSLAPVSLLQFHGDESPQQCAAIAHTVNRPYLRAMRIGDGAKHADLIEYAKAYAATGPLFAGLLLDTLVEGYGGSGKGFDWSVIPEELAPQVVLSGGLSVQNATDAVARVRPFAVDISSGVESAKGVKDADAIQQFVAAVRLGDALPRRA